MSGRIDTSELVRLAASFTQASAAVTAATTTVVTATAARIQADAKAMAPVDTGHLRNSITTTITRGTGGVVAEIGPTANYGSYVELGTSRMSPQPYLYPAADRNAPAFVAALEAIAGRLP